MKQQYTYTLKNENSNKIPIYNSNSPKNACLKIINRLLRDENDDIKRIPITIINLETQKKYYYIAICIKNNIPIKKVINKHKAIYLRYSVFVEKKSSSFIEFGKNT